MEETPNTKNDNGMYKPNAFLKIRNTFFNHVASAIHPIAAGNCRLHYLYSGKKNPINMSPQTFYTSFHKALHAVKLLDCYYEKDLDDDRAKILFLFLP